MVLITGSSIPISIEIFGYVYLTIGTACAHREKKIKLNRTSDRDKIDYDTFDYTYFCE
jgi:hypothetical protein